MADIINAKVLKYDPSIDEAPHYQTYEVEWVEDESGIMSALQVLHEVNKQEPLGYDWCCHSGLCGRCAIKIDGIAGLACWTPMTRGEHTFEPLDRFPVIRDLVVDKEKARKKLISVDTSIHTLNPITDFKPIDFDLYWDKLERLNMCRECMSCMSVCPVLGSGHWADYAGPAAFAAIAQRHLDTIDESDRLGQAVFSGLFKCAECGICTSVCPSRIPIMELIVDMKKEARELGLEYDDTARTLY